MAIIANYTDDRNNVYKDQYLKIHRVVASKNSMIVEVGIHFSKESSDAGIVPHTIYPIMNVEFNMDSSENQWQQGYAGIKKFWTEFTDC